VRKITLLAACLLAVFAFGCSEDDDNVNSSSGATLSASSADLYGLVDNRQIVYLQTDTTWQEDFSFVVTTRRDTVYITGDNSGWKLQAGEIPVINLNVTDGWIIQNGYYEKSGVSYSLVDIDPPPVILWPGLKTGDSRDGYFPPFPTSQDYTEPFFMYSYFGLYFTRRYAGREQIHVPGGSFNAYRFDVELFWTPSDDDPAATAQEYFVPSIGLVKHQLVGGFLRRNLSLVSYR